MKDEPDKDEDITLWPTFFYECIANSGEIQYGEMKARNEGHMRTLLVKSVRKILRVM